MIQAAAPVQRQQSGEKHPFGDAEGCAVSASGGRSHRKGKTKAVKQQNGANYTVVFTINADVPPPPPAPVVAKRVEAPVYTPRPSEPARNPFKSQNDRLTAVTSSNTVTRPAVSARRTPVSGDKVIIAIDAGHGGQDPRRDWPGRHAGEKRHYRHCP